MSEIELYSKTAVDSLGLSAELASQFAQMCMMIPGDSAGGYESILAQLFGAEDLDALSAPWETTDIDDLVGKVVRIDSLTRRPSDFKQGLGVFLVVHGVNTHTGESMTITTSSIAVMGQLARAYMLQLLPCYAEWVKADRPTEQGYYPHHLKLYGHQHAAQK